MHVSGTSADHSSIPSDGDQYFSIDLLDAKADPESAKKSDVLGNLYSPKTKPYAPPEMVRAPVGPTST